MKYGHFNKAGTEFIIDNPVTPRPWINYLTNENYCAIISQSAGGYSFYKDCRSDRILRWAPENWHTDRPGRYLYIKSKIPASDGSLPDGRQAGAFGGKNQKSKIWSATFQPLRIKPQFYRCRHGLGYTVIETIYDDVKTRITYFVPVNDTCEIWLVQISNLSNQPKHLQIFPYIEWLIGDYHLELRYRNIMNLYNRIWFDKSLQTILAKKTAVWNDLNIQPFSNVLFFSSSLKVVGYATRKDLFLGKYNTEEDPQVLKLKKFNNTSLCSGEDGIAAFSHTLKLSPQQDKEFSIVLGQTDGLKNVKRLVSKYRNLSTVKSELEKVQTVWKKRVMDNIVISTPDRELNTLMNIWTKYQIYICNFWSRSPSYYHEGSGGRGYRDSCQDADGICSINSEHTREKILTLARLIREDGTCAPGWSTTHGPATFRPNKDHPVWLTYTVSSYIKETGDKKILLEKLPYLKDCWIKGWEIDKKWSSHPVFIGKGTLYEHLWKNLDFTYNDIGKHGFPKIGHADWNDAIDSAGIRHRGESVMIAMQLVKSLETLSKLAKLINKLDNAKELLCRAETMKKRIEKFGWDGNWYIRGITDDGYTYGSKKCKEGKIFLNTQTWALLAGIPSKTRIKKMLQSVDRYLDGEHGYALFYPAYSKWDSRLGRISMFSEGTKENAAVFCHSASFMVIANCICKRGAKAYESMKKIMPNSQKNYDLYKTEPYVFAEYLIGPEHPYLYGEGAFTWITGTAAWSFLAVTEWIFGVRCDYGGLLIDPCIPFYWKECRIRRPFRGAVYNIHIQNPDGKEKGVKEITVDGKKIEGNLIHPHSDGQVHKVIVNM